MRRNKRRKDLFRARFGQTVGMGHPLGKLAERFGAVYADIGGRPPLATRLLVRLAILKPMPDLSDVNRR
jgi:hypothetical protein